MKRDIGQEPLAGIEAIKSGKGKRVTVNLPTDVKAIRNKTGLSQSVFAGLEAWADQEEDYVDFDPADYVDNPVALARIKAQVKQIDLARHMKVTQSYIFKLEHADQVSDEAWQKVKAALQELRKR